MAESLVLGCLELYSSSYPSGYTELVGHPTANVDGRERAGLGCRPRTPCIANAYMAIHAEQATGMQICVLFYARNQVFQAQIQHDLRKPLWQTIHAELYTSRRRHRSVGE
jgi:hypothetical protein